MEIEYEKSGANKKKRKNEQIQQVLTHESFKVPLKKFKGNNIDKKSHLLNITEKSLIHLHDVVGTEPKNIANSLMRDKRTVLSVIKNAKTNGTFSENHSSKGRWKKGQTKLENVHKKFLLRWLENNEITSVRKAWLRLSSIKNIKRVSYNPVKN